MTELHVLREEVRVLQEWNDLYKNIVDVVRKQNEALEKEIDAIKQTNEELKKVLSHHGIDIP